MVEGYRSCVLTQEGFNNRRQIEYRSGVSNEFAYFVAGNSWKVVPFIGAGNSSDCQAGASGDDDFWFKNVQAWGLFYAAIAAGLAWTEANVSAKPVSWVLSAFAFVITIFIWAVDFRHRKSLAHSKQIGRAIEESRESAIPESQRFFASIKSGWLTHSLVIDMLSGLMFSVLLRASCFF